MNNKTTLLITGLLATGGGIFALFNPLAATLTVEQLVAWLLLFVGGLQWWAAWKLRGIGSVWWLLFGGLLSLVIGGFLLFNPLQGAATLTVIIAVLLAIGGGTRLALAFAWRGSPLFFPTLLSALISLLLAGFIFANFPQSAASILGIFLAVELISSGVTMLFLSRQIPTQQ